MYSRPNRIREGIMKEKENRKFQRFDKEFTVQLRAKPDEKFRTVNIGKGGMFVEVDEPMEVNTATVARIKFNRIYVQVVAKVVWKQTDKKKGPLGNGFEFLETTPLFLNEFDEAI